MLVLNQFALPRSAPGGTRHVELFESLSGWRATVVAGRRSLLDQSPVDDEGSLITVPVPRFKGNGALRVLNWACYSIMALVRGLLRKPVDVVYGSSPHLGAALVGWVIATAHRSRFVLEVRDLWPQILVDSGMLAGSSRLYRLLKALERFLYRRADAIVVLARGSIEAVVAEGIDPTKVHFIPNGADPEDFSVPDGRDELRAGFGLSGTTVVYAGAHGPANGLDLVLDAAEQLREADVTFLLVGGGVFKDRLIEEADRRKLDSVRFLDPIPKAEIPRLLAAADVGLHCLADIELFHHGVSPNKLYDYMAAGLPVVTNTPGEVAAIVEEADAGVAVQPGDIAAGIEQLLSYSPGVRHKLGENGRLWMVEHRSRQARAAALAEVLVGS